MPLDKRGSTTSRQGTTCDHIQSINFTSGVTTSLIFFCSPFKSNPDPPQEVCGPCKTIKNQVTVFFPWNICFTVWYVAAFCYKKKKKICFRCIHPSLDVWVLSFEQNWECILCDTTLCHQIIAKTVFSCSTVDSSRALHHRCAQPPTSYFTSKISWVRKWTCDLFAYVDPTTKPSSLVLLRGGGTEHKNGSCFLLPFV